MASHRQLEANRANAKRSTGPRSAEGKARSSRNSLAHGLSAQDIVINDEDPTEFELLFEGLLADFSPTTTVERKLVERLAGLLWRLQRVPVLEAALFNVRQEETESRDYYRMYVTTEELVVLTGIRDRLRDPSDRKVRREISEKLLGPFFPKAADSSDVGSPNPGVNAEEISDVEKPNSAEAYDQPAGEHPNRYPPKQELRLRRIEGGGDGRRSIRMGLALIKDAEKHDVLGKLSRYEASLANAVARTLILLHSIQNSGLIHKEEIPPRELEVRRRS